MGPRKRGTESDVCTGRMFHTKSQTDETVGKDWHSRLVGWREEIGTSFRVLKLKTSHGYSWTTKYVVEDEAKV